MKYLYKSLFISVIALFTFSNSQAQCSPPLDLGADTIICANGALLLNAGAGYLSYTWQDSTTDQFLLITAPGTYWVQIVDTAFCVARDTIIVTEVARLIPDLGPDTTFCEGDSITLNAGGNFFTYLWPDSSTDQTFLVNQAGSYFVFTRDSNNCLGLDTINIQTDVRPFAQLTPTQSGCEGDSIILDPGAFSSYMWSSGHTTQTISTDTSGFYFVEVTDGNGCRDTSNLAFVSITPNPAQPTISGGPAMITSSSSATYQWFLNGVALVDDTNQTVIPQAGGYYSVQVTSLFGCMSVRSDSLLILLSITKDDIPDGFSPNGDGINDIFRIQFLELFAGNTFKVFNRWGGEVFEAKGYSNDWNGQSKNGNDLPDGSYYFILDLGNGDSPIQGMITISR